MSAYTVSSKQYLPFASIFFDPCFTEKVRGGARDESDLLAPREPPSLHTEK